MRQLIFEWRRGAPGFPVAPLLTSKLRTFELSTSSGVLGLAQDAIDSGPAYGALALGHATTRVGDVYRSFELALLLALHAISLALICLSHTFLRSPQVLGGDL